MELTTDNVDAIAKRCLMDGNDERVAPLKEMISSGASMADVDAAAVEKGLIPVRGIARNFMFDAEKIEKNREDIASLLSHTDPGFHKDTGGGATFMRLSVDKSEKIWGSQQTAEVLMCLAIAARYGSYCMPRDLWGALPGGVPYVVFDLTAK